MGDDCHGLDQACFEFTILQFIKKATSAKNIFARLRVKIRLFVCRKVQADARTTMICEHNVQLL